MFKSIRWGTTKYADLHGTFCRPKTVCTTAAHFVARRQIVHGGDEMCRQRRYNLSPATNCAGATKCAVTPLSSVWIDQLFKGYYLSIFARTEIVSETEFGQNWIDNCINIHGLYLSVGVCRYINAVIITVRNWGQYFDCIWIYAFHVVIILLNEEREFLS